MVTLEQWLLFAGAAAVVIAAPGPDNLATLSVGLARGRGPAMGFAAGCALGCLTHTLWAVLGVSALLSASATAFQILKLAGAAYMIYLGIGALRSKPASIKTDERPGAVGTNVRTYMVRGFISNAINPKVALFFLAFLPQFVRAGDSAAGQIAILGMTFAVMTALAFMTLGYFSGHVGAWLRQRPGVSRWMDRLTGGLFIGLGVRLALAERRF